MKIKFNNYELDLSFGKRMDNTSNTPPPVQQEEEFAKKVVPAEPDVDLPVKGGRSSIPDSVSLLSFLQGEFGTVNPEFNIEFLKALEHLAMYNPDVSKAVDNIVSLGNTPYKIEYDDKIDPALSREMNALLRQKARRWYNHSNGVNSLINDLFAQVVITGAISSELIPEKDLSGIGKVVLVSPKNIRFVYSDREDRFKPYQQLKGQINIKTTTGLKELNESTYKYIALRRFNENPYAVPPFLSALENIQIERDQICNMKAIMKKLGILGFLNVLIQQPSPNPGELPSAYQDRVNRYLQQVAPEISGSLSHGYVIGFKGTHEFTMEGVQSNVQGAKDLIEINNESKFAGLKQDGLMFGRNNSTTETLARVLIAIVSAQVSNYQATVASLLRELFLTHLILAGYPVRSLEVVFDKPMVGDKLKDEQAMTARIANAFSMQDRGIISQQQTAEYLGYEEPDLDEPPVTGPVLNPKTGHPKFPEPDPLGSKRTEPNIKEAINAFEAEFRIDAPEFEYVSACDCSDHRSHVSFASQYDKDGLERYESKYRAASAAKYRAATDKVTKAISNELASLGQGASLEQVTDKVFYTLYKNWKANFTDPQKAVIKQNIREAYVFFRKNKAPFGGKADVPEATFGLTDTRTMQYFATSDELYLGKFITDADTRKALTAFIKDQYIEKSLPLGSKEGLAAFREKFGDLLKGEEWKLDRIIATTVNKLRNFASVAYMEQAGIESFEIVGVNDRLQCDYCKTLQGKTFSLSVAFDKVESITKSEPEHVKYDAPFVTSIFKKASDMEGLTSEQLQAKGVDVPPFHSNCRDVIVAVL